MNAHTSSPSDEIPAALDYLNFEEIYDLALQAASLWDSIALAAERREPMTLGVHLKQVRLLTYATFQACERVPRAAP